MRIIYKNVFDSSKTISLKKIIGSYFYKDYLGEVFNVEITESSWNEKMSSSNNYIKFYFNESNKSLVFKESNDIFFQDFYKKGEEIEIKYVLNKTSKLEIVFDYGNDIYIKKTLIKKE